MKINLQAIRKVTALGCACALFFSTILVAQAAALTTLTLTSPAGGEMWSGTQSVTWTSDGDGTSGDMVEIMYSADGGAFFSTLTTVEDEGSSGSSFSVDTTTVSDGTEYQVKIISGLQESVSANFTIDNTVPVITLTGSSTVDLTVGDSYTDEGATANDNIDGDITADIVVGGDTVDTSAEGTYIVTYNVSDGSGNAAVEVTRMVNVATGSSGSVSVNLLANSTADELTISEGTEFTLTWDSENATSCTGDMNGTSMGGVDTDGSSGPFGSGHSLYPTATTSSTFTITCTDGSEEASDSVEVSLSSAATGTASTTIFANGTSEDISISDGTGLTISWASEDVTSCELDVNNGENVSGVATTGEAGPFTTGHPFYPTAEQESTFLITCTDGSTVVSDSLSVFLSTGGGGGGGDEATSTLTSLTLTAPTGGEVWSGNQNITWTSNGTGTSSDMVNISYSSDGGSFTTIGTVTDEGTGGSSFSVDTTTVPNGTQYVVKISLEGDDSVSDTSGVFTISNASGGDGDDDGDDGDGSGTSTTTLTALDSVLIETTVNTAVTFTLNTSTTSTTSLTYIIVTLPAHGTLSATTSTTTNEITYTPGLNYTGPDSFTFKVNDGTGDTNVATVSLQVNPVNPAPSSSSGGGGGSRILSTTPLFFSNQFQFPFIPNTGLALGTGTGMGTGSAGGQVLGTFSFRFLSNLGFGNRSEFVLELQKKLAALGFFQVQPTGFFGPITRAAVRAFQESRGVISTGFVGPLTRAELNR